MTIKVTNKKITQSDLDIITRSYWESIQDRPVTEDDLIDELNRSTSDIRNKITDERFIETGTMKRKITDEIFKDDLTEDQYKLKLTECNKTNLKELDKLKSALSKNNKVSYNSFKGIEAVLKREARLNKIVLRDTPNFEFNHDVKLASELRKTFEFSKQHKKIKLKITGRSPNINRFIQSKFNGDYKIFKNVVRENMLNITIVLDMSGSMDADNNIKTSVELIATLFKSIDRMNTVKINVIGYSSNFYWIANKFSEVGNLARTYGGTPTATALTYAKSKMKKSDKNILILITDGQPDGIRLTNQGSFISIPTTDYLKQLVSEMKKDKIESFGFLIGSGSFQSFAKIFEKNFIQCSNLRSARQQIIETFTQFIKGNSL